jgi:hypothetical protein
MSALFEEKYELVLMAFLGMWPSPMAKGGEDYTSLGHPYSLVDKWDSNWFHAKTNEICGWSWGIPDILRKMLGLQNSTFKG